MTCINPDLLRRTDPNDPSAHEDPDVRVANPKPPRVAGGNWSEEDDQAAQPNSPLLAQPS